MSEASVTKTFYDKKEIQKKDYDKELEIKEEHFVYQKINGSYKKINYIGTYRRYYDYDPERGYYTSSVPEEYLELYNEYLELLNALRNEYFK